MRTLVRQILCPERVAKDLRSAGREPRVRGDPREAARTAIGGPSLELGRNLRIAVLALLAVAGAAMACATTPGQIHELADADDAKARAEAVVEARRWLLDTRAPNPLRMSAARALGRLRATDGPTVDALAASMKNRRNSLDLRRMAAWALGELRSRASLDVLSRALRARLDARVGTYVLEAVAKHTSLLASDEETLLTVVENLVFYAGNRRSSLPPVYDLLTARTRTVDVNVRVLARTVRETRQRASPGQRAALYSAAFELLERLHRRREEMSAGPAQWAPKVDAALDVAGSAYEVDDLRTQILVLYFLGRLATAPEVAADAASAAARLDIGRTPTTGLQLLAAWALDRLQVTALGPRRILITDVLSRARHPALLELIGDLARPRAADATTMDAPQRWLELGGLP